MTTTCHDKDTTTQPPPTSTWTPAEYLFDARSEETMIAAIDSIAGLPPNWDGNRALAFSPDMIVAARSFAREIAGWTPRPRVVPLSSGAIQFEWVQGSRELEFELDSLGTVHFLKWSPSENVEEEGTFSSAQNTRAKLLVTWLAEGHTQCTTASQAVQK